MILEAATVLLMMADADRALARKGQAGSPPWVAEYPEHAAAIARVSNENPLFRGEDGPARTAAWLVSVGRFESGFRREAAGDSPCLAKDASGACTRRGKPTSFCAMQVSNGNFAGLGVTEESIVKSLDVCYGAGLRMMHDSMRVCSGRPLNERLAWYAAGGNGCTEHPDAVAKSQHRANLGAFLFEKAKARAVEAKL